MQKVSIIIPAYNEEKRIGSTLESYSLFFEILRKNGDFDYEIIVVINNTKDKTEDIVRSQIEKNGRIRYLNFEQGGKGFAVIEGFKDALKRDSNLIGFVDADMATAPEAFHFLIKNINQNDGVIASRYIRGARVNPKPTIQRMIASRIFNMLIRVALFMPYRDTQCGAKLFKREALEKTIGKLSMSQWAFDVELLYQFRKNKFNVREIPTKWSDKEYSTIHFAKAGPFMAMSIIRLRLLNSPLNGFVRLYNKYLDYYRKNYKGAW